MNLQRPTPLRLLTMFLGATLLVPLLVGCPHVRSRKDQLRFAVMEYNDGIRWQRWKAAAAYLPADKREDFLSRKEAEAESLRVTEFEIRDVDRDDAEQTADVLIVFTWHRYPSLTMHSTRVHQQWAYLGGRWVLLSQEEAKEIEPSTTPSEMF